MPRSDFEEREDSWKLLIEGGEVFAWGRDDTDFRLELSWPAKGRRGADDRVDVFAAASASHLEGEIAVGARVQNFLLCKDGRLTVLLEGGRLDVEPASDHEAWEIRGQDLMVCPTGGGEPLIWFGDGPVLTGEEARRSLGRFPGRANGS